MTDESLPLKARRDVLEARAEERRLRDEGWPPALVRAAFAEGSFAANVVALGVIRFTLCEDAGNGWVRLHLADGSEHHLESGDQLDLRLADVRWVSELGRAST